MMREMHGVAPAGIRAIWAGIATILVMVAGLATAATAAFADEAEGGRLTWGIAPADAVDADGRGTIEHLAEPGQSITEHVVVRNIGTGELQLDLYAADAAVTGGIYDLLTDEDPAEGIGAWSTPGAAELTLGPGERTVVPLQIDVPADAEPGDHAGGVVAVLRSTGGDEQLQVERRVGTRIYLRVAGTIDPRLGVEILDAEYHHNWLPFARGEVTATLRVHNDGNIRLAGVANAQVRSIGGWSTADSEPLEVPELLPGEELSFEVELGPLAPLGPLDLTAAVEPLTSGSQDLSGTVSPGTAELRLWAVPWSTLVLLALAAGALVWLRISRSAQTPRRQSAQPSTP